MKITSTRTKLDYDTQSLDIPKILPAECGAAAPVTQSRGELLQIPIDQDEIISLVIREQADKTLSANWKFKVAFTQDLAGLRKLFAEQLQFSINGRPQAVLSNIANEPFRLEVKLGNYTLFDCLCDPKSLKVNVNKSNPLYAYDLRQLNQRGIDYLEQLNGANRKAQLPKMKADLHTHFGGAINAHAMVDAIRQHNQPVPYPVKNLKEMGVVYSGTVDDRGNIDLAASDSHLMWGKFADNLTMNPLRVETFLDMERVYRFRSPIVKNLSLFPVYLKQLAKDYQRMGIEYVELSISDIVKPEWLEIANKLAPDLETEYGVKMRFLVGFWRHSPPLFNEDLLAKVKALKHHPLVVGIDVMGDETNSTRDFADLLDQCATFRKEQRPDFVIRVHAGESPCHPDNVRLAIEHGATRIGHGVYGFGPEVIALAKEKDVIFEINLSSNEALNSVICPKEQIPLREMIDSGVRVTLGTDGHGCYRTNHKLEAYYAMQLGLTQKDLEGIKASNEAYIDSMQAHYCDRLCRETDPFHVPVYPPAVFPSDGWALISQRKAAEKRQLSECLAKTKNIHSGESVKILSMDELDSTFSGRVPLRIVGATSVSWDPVDQEDKVLIKQQIARFLHHLDQDKLVLVTGGTDFGLEKLVHESVAELAEEGKEFQLLGTLATSLQAEPETVSSSLTHAVLVNGSWYDIDPEILRWLNSRGGINYFIGGGGVIKSGMHIAKTLGNIDFFAMSDISYGTSRDAAKLFPDRAFSKRDGLDKALLHSKHKNLLRSVELSPDEALEYFRGTGKSVLSFLGYSTEYKDPEGLRSQIRELLSFYDPERHIINAGATSSGIGQVYSIAKEMGFQTTGIVSSLAERASISEHVDLAIYIRDKQWGGYVDDSLTLSPVSVAMESCSHEAICLGGGRVAKVEAQAIQQSGKDVIFFPFARA